MAQLAEETVVQRVAALVRGLHRQEDPAVLTRVAILMEVFSHVLDFEGILPVSGNDGILTDAAHRGELPREKETQAQEAFTPTTAEISCQNLGWLWFTSQSYFGSVAM